MWQRCGGQSTALLLFLIQRVKINSEFWEEERPRCQESQNLPFSSSVWSASPARRSGRGESSTVPPRLPPVSRLSSHSARSLARWLRGALGTHLLLSPALRFHVAHQSSLTVYVWPTRVHLRNSIQIKLKLDLPLSFPLDRFWCFPVSTVRVS